MINVQEVKGKKDFKAFFRFPLKLYKGHSRYVPILLSEEEDEFTPSKNGAYEFCESKMFLARNEKGEIVGRIAAILNKACNEKTNQKQMRFSRIDAINDSDVFSALIQAVKAYAVEKGMTEIIGPLGFCDLDQQGLLVEGFDEEDMYINAYSEPYYAKQLERIGFVKNTDWKEYRLTVPTQMDERLPAIVESIQKKYGYRYLVIKNKAEVPNLIRQALKIMNEAYAPLFGYVQLNETLIEHCIPTYSRMLRPEFVTIVVDKEGKMVGYGFFAPSLSKVMQKAWGKLGLSDLIRFMKCMKKNDVVDLYSIGVLPELANTGIGAMILYNSIDNLIKTGVKYAESGPELETNANIQNLWKNFEHRQHRRRRCYTIQIDQLPE